MFIYRLMVKFDSMDKFIEVYSSHVYGRIKSIEENYICAGYDTRIDWREEQI